MGLGINYYPKINLNLFLTLLQLVKCLCVQATICKYLKLWDGQLDFPWCIDRINQQGISEFLTPPQVPPDLSQTESPNAHQWIPMPLAHQLVVVVYLTACIKRNQ